ncbi:MAG: endolytic transglycosylase MltG [Tissierellia bacterium]|nr:endolytic transglycosylase MltG [Tissierellia bacterium]
MDNFWEKLKDILYDGTDYIIMIITILIVVLIINWRIGGLFNRTKIDNKEKDKIETIGENNDNLEDNKDNEPKNSENENNSMEEESPNLIIVNIPTGSLPGKIGEILESKGLVESKEEFVEKTIEMKMDTKLKSGDFEIPDNSTIEDIINIISK